MSEWERHIAASESLEDPVDRELLGKALLFLRAELGESFLHVARETGHELHHWVADRSDLTRADTIGLADALASARPCDGYAAFLRDLSRAHEFRERLSVLRVVAFLSRAGFKCAFDVPVEIDGQAKVPDLSVAKGDVSAVVEVTRLCFPLRVEEEFERLEAEALEAIRAGRPARSVRGQPVEASSSIRIGRSIRKKRGRAGRAGQVPRNALGVVVVDADDGGLSLAEPWPEIERAIVEAMKDAPTLAACIFRRAHIAPRHIADETRTVTRISSSAILVQRCLRSGELEELFLAANEACTLDGCARLLDELRQAIEG